jgi:hypothetical protein
MSNPQAKEFFGIGGWPLCAVCNKPVEKMEVFNDLHAHSISSEQYSEQFSTVCCSLIHTSQ